MEILIPHAVFLNPHSQFQALITPPSTLLFPQTICYAKEDKRDHVKIAKAIENSLLIGEENIPIPEGEFISFSNFKMENMIEHLQKPFRKLDRIDHIIQDGSVISVPSLTNNWIWNQPINSEVKSIESTRLNEKCMYDMIYELALPRWTKYLKMKSERSIDTQIKPRPDTLWKKIFRDVREFFRILFRVRFHFLDYRNANGATMCVKILFEELGIPLTDEEVKDHKLFRFIHQTHKSKLNICEEFAESPFEVIEKFNDLYKKLFMTNFTCARLLYFVFQNFLEVYSSNVKPVYSKEVITMICMILNCYKRMSSYHHVQRIC